MMSTRAGVVQRSTWRIQNPRSPVVRPCRSPSFELFSTRFSFNKIVSELALLIHFSLGSYMASPLLPSPSVSGSGASRSTGPILGGTRIQYPSGAREGAVPFMCSELPCRRSGGRFSRIRVSRARTRKPRTYGKGRRCSSVPYSVEKSFSHLCPRNMSGQYCRT